MQCVLSTNGIDLSWLSSSPVIEATNDLYRSLSDLVKWADEMSLPSGEESEQSNSSVHLDAVTVVSQNLLLSFKVCPISGS